MCMLQVCILNGIAGNMLYIHIRYSVLTVRISNKHVGLISYL